MSPETRDFLASIRRAEDPSPGDESRVLGALQATIATSLTSAAAGNATATKGVVSAAGSGLKVVGALLGVSLGAVLVAAAVSSGPDEPRVAPQPGRASISDASVRSSAPAVPSAVSPPSASADSLVAAPPSAANVARPKAPSTSASLRDEITLLAGVQSALERGEGAEALRRLDAHTTNDRQFVAERRAARIAALCLLGRAPEAKQLAAVFFRENAQSVQRTAVERSCAATKTNLER